MKRGFTLIELLAVIIILAIIALIATPIVLNVVNEAKEKALVQSANGIVDGAKYVYLESLLKDSQVTTGNAKDLVVSGERATAGTWTVNAASTGADAGITITDVTFASMPDWTCNSVNGKVECAKN